MSGPPSKRAPSESADVLPALTEGDDPLALQQAVDEIVNLVPKGQREAALQKIVQVVSTVEEFRGQLPHPKHAAEYESICPGALDRLIQMREQELAYAMERDRAEREHAYQWENRDQSNAAGYARYGMTCGFLLGAGLIIGAVICAYLNQQALGGGLVAASAVSMVPAFLNGKRERGGRRDADSGIAASAPSSARDASPLSPSRAPENKAPARTSKRRR